MKKRLRKNLARFLFACAIYGTLIGAFYTFENWRWKRAWENYAADRRQKPGPWFDRAIDAAPPEVSDAENAAMTPLLLELVETPADKFQQTRGFRLYFEFAGEGIVLVNWMRGRWPGARPVDLAGFQALFRGGTNFPSSWGKEGRQRVRSFERNFETAKKRAEKLSLRYLPTDTPPQSAAKDVLLVLQRHEAELNEITRALQRPHARFPLPYETERPFLITPRHVSPLQTFALLFKLKAAALLAEGKTDDAFEQAQLVYRLADTLKGEPFAISQIIRGRILDYAHGIVWEGLLHQRWSSAHLQQFEQHLASVDPFEQFIRVQAFERLGMEHEIIRIAKDRSELPYFVSKEDWPQLRWTPTGWFRANLLTTVRRFDFWADAGAKRRGLVDLLASRSPEVGLKTAIARNLDRNWERHYIGVWRQSIHVELTRTACRIERFHIANGAYPQSLDQLVPEYFTTVPIDLVNGRPLKYLRSDDARFRLYSVGANSEDDGGQLPPWYISKHEVEYGDWVWRYEPRKEDEKSDP